ncbi:hypothetical protein AVEN_26233-1 [Araneus ventricosus]|uniref:Uncharacterized protein n=1 Tax=Araneus ventricosus TaxID=182803 RepID=A0A4Y2AM01_ARAVE|nr:hypothetical protein AVEN_26233-1 [Araneus ventricosus]
MGHRTEQVPQREVLVNTPTKRAWSSVWRQQSASVDAMKRVSYLQSEGPLATKGQAPQKSAGTFDLDMLLGIAFILAFRNTPIEAGLTCTFAVLYLLSNLKEMLLHFSTGSDKLYSDKSLRELLLCRSYFSQHEMFRDCCFV